MKAIYSKYDYDVSSATDIGFMRFDQENQDELILQDDIGFYAVLDGMGGLHGGGIASHMAKHIFPDLMREALHDVAENQTISHMANILNEQVVYLSDSIYESSNRIYLTSGSTISGVWLAEDRAIFVNMGDSRGYHLPNGEKEIRQITRDHNEAALLVEKGRLSKEKAIGHPLSCELTAFIGMKPSTAPDIFIQSLQPGDKILLCTDGLYGMVKEKRISSILNAPKSLDMICSQLVNEANENGGDDNIAVICIEIKS
ncbi:MAG: protein phosphatase 2C domain-containing protein [Tannerellaceae bacterium]|jgi:serine/threonine protein phosphatase PrpC|nr:protein phosphatase 2C domain-containing protein [Tannerellaceae bacterium]